MSFYMTRKEIESLLGEKISDEAWEYNQKAFEEYNAEHEDDDLDE